MSDGYAHRRFRRGPTNGAVFGAWPSAAGKVVSYGQLAELAGLGRAARWVGRTQATRLPWHRVLGAGAA
jgi:methylated-DNA-protein-cysteine methyltransferase-like protein